MDFCVLVVMNLSSVSLGFYGQTGQKMFGIWYKNILYTNNCLKHLIFLLYLQSKKQLFKTASGGY